VVDTRARNSIQRPILVLYRLAASFGPPCF
jgi:hypothetical protein